MHGLKSEFCTSKTQEKLVDNFSVSKAQEYGFGGSGCNCNSQLMDATGRTLGGHGSHKMNLQYFASEGGSSSRTSWRQSELDAAKDFPESAEQKSYINGQEVPYGTKGSVRPDLYKKGSSIDVKNYKLDNSSGRNNLARNIQKQYYQRLSNLPEGTQQSVLIDVRGQNVSNADLAALYNDIMNRTNNGVTIRFKTN